MRVITDCKKLQSTLCSTDKADVALLVIQFYEIPALCLARKIANDEPNMLLGMKFKLDISHDLYLRTEERLEEEITTLHPFNFTHPFQET